MGIEWYFHPAKECWNAVSLHVCVPRFTSLKMSIWFNISVIFDYFPKAILNWSELRYLEKKNLSKKYHANKKNPLTFLENHFKYILVFDWDTFTSLFITNRFTEKQFCGATHPTFVYIGGVHDRELSTKCFIEYFTIDYIINVTKLPDQFRRVSCPWG